MSDRVFEGRIAQGIAPDDRARQDRLKATARALVTAVREGLVRDGVVRLHGFGTFRLRPVAARRGRHPRTGDPIDIPAGWRVMFRPAKALRERVEPDRAPALLIGEPHASREAMLAASAGAGAQTIRRGAGRIPAEGMAAPPPVAPERAAAAAMPERKFSVQGPIPPALVSAEPEDLEADSCVTRSPAALTRAPAANEASPSNAASREAHAEVRSAPDPSPAPSPEADTRRRRQGHPYALVLLLLLLLAGLAWLFRPVDSPAPRLVEESGTRAPAEVSGDAASGGWDAATSSDPIVVQEPEGTTADAESSSGQSGTEGDAAAARETAEAPAAAAAERDVPASSEDTRAAGEDEVEVADGGDTAIVSTERTTAGTGTREDPARADEPAPAAGADASSGDEVVAALSRAAAASGTTTADTVDARTEQATAGEAGGETAADTGAASDAAAGTRPADGAGSDGQPWFSGRDYTVRAGDSLWDLADRNYVNPYYWPHIWRHNADIANPDRLEVRQGLWLPTLEGKPQALTEADRRSIAEGYMLLYRFFREQGDANPQYALVGVRYFDPSVLPERLRGTAAGHPGDTLAAVFQARLEAEFPLD